MIWVREWDLAGLGVLTQALSGFCSYVSKEAEVSLYLLTVNVKREYEGLKTEISA